MTDYDDRHGIARRFQPLADAIVAEPEPPKASVSVPDWPVCACGHRHWDRPGQAESGWHHTCPKCKCRKHRV